MLLPKARPSSLKRFAPKSTMMMASMIRSSGSPMSLIAHLGGSDLRTDWHSSHYHPLREAGRAGRWPAGHEGEHLMVHRIDIVGIRRLLLRCHALLGQHRAYLDDILVWLSC